MIAVAKRRETKEESGLKRKSKDKTIERIAHAIRVISIVDMIIIQLTSLRKKRVV